MEAMKEYVAHLDNKKRITLRGAAYQYYKCKKNTEMVVLFWNLGNSQCQRAFQPALWQIWIVR